MSRFISLLNLRIVNGLSNCFTNDSVSKFSGKSYLSNLSLIYQKHFFKLIPKSISKFPKVWKLKNGKSFYSWLFVTLPSDSLQFQNELMRKSETRSGFRPFRNSLIYKKLTQTNNNPRRRKSCISFSIKPPFLLEDTFNSQLLKDC